MRDVAIVGIGQTPVREHWDQSLRHLGHTAVQAALADAGIETVDALYVGNMLSGELSGQEHLATLIADFSGLRGIEAAKVEAACASGAAAMHMGVLAVASGWADVVVVLGLEKMTDTLPAESLAGLAMATDQDYEAAHGVTLEALAALLMQRYLYEYDVPREDFAVFPIIAHDNAMGNPHAMFHLRLTPERYQKAPITTPPLNMMDGAPLADGAAAVVLMPYDQARAQGSGKRLVRVAASVSATDTLSLHDRVDPLWLEAAAISSHKAYAQAQVTPNDIHFIELHDAYSILAALALEASGFAPRGKALDLATSGALARDGRLPINTMGGLKARGNPVGATGLYQIVEATMQLRGEAGPNQLARAHIAMTQNMGGPGSTVITHILVGK